MRIRLVRHAHALSRLDWRESDAARPLSEKGHAQAQQLAALAVDANTAVLSSPAVRCVDTVRLLADRLGTSVVIDERLAEGGDAHAVVEWICDPANTAELVLCGHGDVLPEALHLLSMRGMTLDGPNAVRKGSVWTCQITDGRPLHASYTPPPAV
jgi:phosphohistidine phosphatase SixA